MNKTKNIIEIDGYNENLKCYMTINDNIKSKLLEFLEKENKKITQDYSFGNIINILSTYNKFIKDFLSNLSFLLTRVSNEFNNKEQKTYFHEVFYKILSDNNEKWKYISTVVDEIIDVITKILIENNSRYNEDSERLINLKEQFKDKYETNINYYKKYIETFNNLENFYLNNYKKIKEKNEINILKMLMKKKIIKDNEINSVYENYLKSNYDLNDFCANLVSNLIYLLYDYNKYKSNIKDNIIMLTNKLHSSSFFKENKNEINKDEKNDNINKNNNIENFEFLKFEFPIIKYNLELIKFVGLDIENEKLNNINESKNILEIISLLLIHYSKYIKEFDIKKEFNKIEICEFMDNLIEKGKIDENIYLKILEYIKNKNLRKFFLLYINKIRTKGKLSLENAKSMKVFGIIIKEIFNYLSTEENNIEYLKLIIIMSLTYFYINKNGKQIYLSCYLQSFKIIQESIFWEKFMKNLIEFDLKKEKERNTDINIIKHNIVFSKILSGLQDMESLMIKKENVKIAINEVIKYYNLEENLKEQINILIDNYKDNLFNNIDLEKEII